MIKSTEISPELEEWRQKIETWAKEYGLDFYKTHFEVLDWNQMNMVASYGGFPNRYPHWRFGMEYEQLSKSYEYGLSKIYELVINNDPSYAYLLYCNKMVDQKMVMSHVYGHVDFFKNNVFFAPTPKNMMDRMGTHRSRVLRLIDQLGHDQVESFIDTCLSIENLIDFNLPFLEKKREPLERREDDLIGSYQEKNRIHFNKEYLEEFVNPVATRDWKYQTDQHEMQEKSKILRPERDVMGFLLEQAPLARWEYEILNLIRDEAYYFAPQMQTKIMNEGWASFWHSKIMTEKALEGSEIIDFADNHSGALVMTRERLNPYKIGIELFRDIEERWNKGQFGKEFDECDRLDEKLKWDRKLGLGRQKIFEVRKIYNDVTFIDEFFTAEFCRRHKLFAYEYNPVTRRNEISDRDFATIKAKVLQGLTNFGQPLIRVVDANHSNRGELKLQQEMTGQDIDVSRAQETLKSLHRIWKRPVLLECYIKSELKILSYDGETHKTLNTDLGV